MMRHKLTFGMIKKSSVKFFLFFTPSYFLMALIARIRLNGETTGYCALLLMPAAVFLGLVSACLVARWMTREAFFAYLCVSSVIYLLVWGIAEALKNLYFSTGWLVPVSLFPQAFTLMYCAPLLVIHFLLLFFLLKRNSKRETF